MEQQSDAMIIATSTHFLQLSYENRLDIYKRVGIISRQPIRLDNQTNGRIPKQIPRELHTSKELSDDALSVFWSENDFKLYGVALLSLLQLGTPMAWSSLRSLEVVLPIKASIRPGEFDAENAARLRAWQRVCANLGAYSPPSRLGLQFRLIQSGVGSQDRLASAKDALRSMQTLPMLSALSFDFHSMGFRDVGIHRMAIHTLNRLTACPSTEQRSHFRFMGLPTEIQLKILEYTDLVAPGPVVASNLKGYALGKCRAACPRMGFQCCEQVNYDSSKGCCWSLPADLFFVNRYISAMSGEVFFSHNDFVVDVCEKSIYFFNHVQRARPAPLLVLTPDPSPRIPGVWYPEHSEFLLSFPPTCIRFLKSITWRFNMQDHHVAFSDEQKADWNSAIDFIAENVELPRLTITFDMAKSRLRDEVMDPVKKLKGLRGLFVRLSGDLDAETRAAEELRFERLAMGDRYRPTVGELEAREDELFQPKDSSAPN